MAGARVPYDRLSYFFSRVFDLEIDVVGRTDEPEETITLGSPGEGPCVTLAVSGGRVDGIVLLDAPGELESARALVRGRVRGKVLEQLMAHDGASLSEMVRAADLKPRDTGTGESDD